MDKALSSDEINEALGGKTKIITYDKLKDYKSINELLKPFGNVVILYLNDKNFGHWTCLFKNKEGNIEFFDSYGLPMDQELRFIPDELREQLNQTKPILSNLLLKQKKKIIYNNHKLQKLSPKVNTCGRHVITRLLMKNMNIDDYNKFIRSFDLTPDEFVTMLTLDL
jgi:hypothetical protein